VVAARAPGVEIPDLSAECAGNENEKQQVKHEVLLLSGCEFRLLRHGYR
jgi:hypothetical protein